MNYFLLEQNDHIAIVTMNQPQVLNSFSMEVQKEFLALLEELENNPSLQGLIITGAGKAFAAGADIKQMANMNAGEALEFSRLGNRVFDKIESFKAVTVAAINGAALGGGCELALACDYRIAAVEAKLGQPEINLGIIPGWGGCGRLARLVGFPTARELVLSGKIITSTEALALKLVDQVVDKAVLLETAVNLMQNLLKNSPLTLRYAKEALHAGYMLPPDQATRKEQELFSRCFQTEDQKEGMKAFLEKRRPDFQGR